MNVATRLRGAFAIYIALLAAVVVYHVRTIQRTVASGHTLADISTRHRIASTDQLARVTDMASDVEKYLVTRDRGYLDKSIQSANAFGHELARFDSLPLSGGERTALHTLAGDWRGVAIRLPTLGAMAAADSDRARNAVASIQRDLERVRGETEQLGAAAQDAMSSELASSETAAGGAERIAYLAAIGALVLSILLSALLARSILGPLDRLTKGTREVAAGRYDYRLEAQGDDELAQVARDFNSMTERLDELDRLKRDFVAKVSHDLKTPLSSMQETISAVVDGVAGEVSPKQRQLLELNLESGRRLSAMLNKLLDLSRIEAGLEPDMEMLDLVSLVRRSVDRLAAAGAERRVHLAFTEPTQRVIVRGDPSGLAQVVDNLIENAMKFSPSDGVVTVSIGDPGSSVAKLSANLRRRLRGTPTMIDITDQGPGIPDDEKERVFTRFYQTEAGRAARGRGVGLGLTICREIVAAHGGAIWVSDNEPRGSIFHVLLPNAVSAPDPNAGSPTPPVNIAI